MAVASLSSETKRTFTGELQAFTWSAHSVDVTAVSARETWVLLWKSTCKITQQVKINTHKHLMWHVYSVTHVVFRLAAKRNKN